MAQSLYEAISKYKIRFFDSRQHGPKANAPVDFDAIMAEQTGNVNQTQPAGDKTSAGEHSGGVYYCVQLDFLTKNGKCENRAHAQKIPKRGILPRKRHVQIHHAENIHFR